MIAVPGLEERHSRSSGDEVFPFPGPAGVEEAHQVAAVGPGPGEDLEGIAGHPANRPRHGQARLPAPRGSPPHEPYVTS